MTEKRKFTQHILPTSHHSRNKDLENDETDHNLYSLKWGSSTPDPIDYEKYLSKNKGSVLNDPHRELLIFPYEDLKIARINRPFRVQNAGVPMEALKPGAFITNAFARHCISFFATSEWICVYQPSIVYRGHFCKLPRSSTLDTFMGPLIQHWFSTDQGKPEDAQNDPLSIGCFKSSPVHSYGTQAASSRPWTAAVLANRARHMGNTEVASQLSWCQSQQNNSDTKLYMRTNSVKDRNKTSSNALLNGFVESDSKLKDGEQTGESKRDTYLEGSLAVCTRAEYTVCLRVRENLLAAGPATLATRRSSTAPNGIALDAYCLRSIQPDELLPITGRAGPADGLYPGLYVIAPLTWKVNQRLSNNVIRLETVSSVHPIGDNWLKLDRVEQTGLVKDTSSSFSSELFIYFDNSIGGPTTRQTWLDRIQLLARNRVTPSTPTSFYVGPSETQPGRCAAAVSGGNSVSLDGGATHSSTITSAIQFCVDSTSARSALQRYAQETEFFISHQRQKGRLKLITVFPEVRIVYHKSQMAAQDRARIKSSIASYPSTDSMERVPNAACAVTDLRLTRGSNSASGSTSPSSASVLIPVPVSNSAPVLPFPDRTVHLCSHRFLVTCLRLKSRLQCVLESTTSSSGALDNPEPFFLSMYLVNAGEGRRISEEFYWNPNSTSVDSMIPSELFRNLAWSQLTIDPDLLPSEATAVRSSIGSGSHKPSRGLAPPPPTGVISTPVASIEQDRIRHCRSAIFSVLSNAVNLEHIYLVVRVDKVLNGSISSAVEKYTKGALVSGPTTTTPGISAVDNKAACLLSRSMAVYCRHLGRYRMPFAWGARSLCSTSHRLPLFKMDSGRITEAAFMQQIQSLARLMDTTAVSPRNWPSNSPERVGAIGTETNARGALPLDVVERTLKTQAVPVILDVAVSELTDQSTDPGVQEVSVLVTPSLCPTKTGQLVGDKYYFIPPTHPTLTPNELVREVEHFFDIRSIPVVGVGTDSVMYTSAGEPELAILAGHSGTLSRSPNIGTVGAGSRSNRDSMISCSSAGGLPIGLDPATWNTTASAANSIASTRTNSLERSNPRAPTNPTDLSTNHRFPTSVGTDMVPFTSFHNTLYVSPKSLNLAVKHNFSRARNLSCFIELRCNDSLDSTAAIKAFYTRPSPRQAPLEAWCNTTVLYHESSPQFNEMVEHNTKFSRFCDLFDRNLPLFEITCPEFQFLFEQPRIMRQFKLSMPLHITPEHHLFFRFYHVSVDTAGSLTMRDKPSGRKPMESSTGYAWLPLLGPNGNVNTGTFQLSIASEIQPGYLNLRSCSNRGSVPTLTTVNAAGDGSTSWLEGGKPLFTVQLDSLSSIYTNVPVLARFFRACSELAGRVLNLPPPQTTPGSVRTKPNRVTFREDPIEGQSPPSDSCRPSVPAGPAFSDCGRHLCSAIKGLWVIDLSALIHFLPPLFNQFMELILISAAAGHRWSVAVSLPDCKSTSGLTPVWMDFGRSADTTNSPNEILRTTIGTMSVLISELNSSCPVTRTSSVNGYYFDSKNLGLGKLQSEIPRHEWLRNYVKYAFDADGLTVRCAALHTVPEFTKSHPLNRQTTGFPIPLYHALVRGLILVLADTHCAQHILTHLFSNIWFPFALIVKSMSQWLCSSQKIKADRAGEGRFPTSFSDDLALLIKLIGSYLNSAGSNQWLLNGLAQTRQPTKPGLFVPSVNSASTLSAISRSSVSRLSVQSLPNKTVSDVPSGINDESRQQRHTLTVSDTAGQTQKLATAINREGSIPRVPARCATPTVQCDFHGLQLMADTARFLCHLFNLMDRGFVMQRVRDLMIFLEILPRMPVDEIDRLNELRFQLINVLSQHEFFVQLNLPSLGLFQGGMDEEPERKEEDEEDHVNLYNRANRSPYELCLTEQFRQEHFLVGSLLASIACLLAGCINTGSWATGQSAGHLHRQPLVLLRNLLAKHSLDPRYATSKPCQARITALYLPLIRLVLEHPNAIGSPGGALQAAVIAAAARGEFGENANIGGDMRRKKRNTATSGTANAAGASASRPRSFVSDISLETLAAGTSHQSGPHSDSLGSMSLSNGSGEGTHASGGGGSRAGGSYGTGGSASLGGGSSQTSSSTQSSAYLTEDGKVEKHILEQIAGLNAGGPLRRAQLRRFRNGTESMTDPLRTSFKRQSSDSNGAAIPNASSSHSGSTVTLTGLGSGEEDEPNNHVGSNRPVVNVPLDLDEESDIEDDMVDGGLIQVNPVTRLREHRRDKTQQLSSIRMVDDFRDDPDSSQDWASQVLSLAGVFSRPAQQRPPLPEISIQEPPSLPRKSDLNAHRAGVQLQPMSTHVSDSNNNNSCNITAVVDPPHQHRLAPGEMNGPRRLTDKCQRELFVCVLHIMSTVTEDHLTTLFHSFTVQERIHFLCMLTYAIQHLRYRGKKCIQQYEHISHSGIGRTGFGVSGVGAGSSSGGRRSVGASLRPPTPSVVSMHLGGESQSGVLDAKDTTVQAGPNLNSDENESTSKVLLEANLATEAGLIVLDLVNTFTSVFKRQLESCKPSDPVFTGLLEVYVALLTNNPSECLLRHTFASLRVFVSRFAKVLFCESTEILSTICLTSLRCANQSLPMPSPVDSRNENGSNQSQTHSALPSAARSLSPRRESSTQPLQTMNGIGMGPLSPTAMIRMEACGLLYKLWKSSYENFGRTGFYRVHLQTIISVSKLVTEIGPGFEASLSLLHTLVETDMRRGIGDTGAITPETKFWSRAESRNMFVDDVNDLIRRVRTVLIATNEMRQHNDDHERLIDLQYCLAKSYSSNPALRRTWLDELAKLHMASKSLAELAMVKLHSAALMAEYLKSRNSLGSEFPQGCEAFSAISSNICQEENGLRTDSALLEIPYTQEDLLLDINEAATTLEAAGLFEAIRPVYALVIPVYEARQEYTALAQIYRHIGRAYDAIGHAEASGHRLFAAYFRVTFYGQLFESLANKSFIYRTNACQKLGGMCNELLTLYRNKYGQGVVDLLTDYAYNRETADSNKAYIQVNYVEPYKGPIRSGRPLTSFEKHHDVSQFMFETPFLLQPGMTTTASLLAAGPKHSDDLTQQWKRRTILTTSGTFPHLRRRLEVVHVTETDLCPIDAAIDAIECKNQELMTHISAIPVVTPPAIDVSNGQGDREAQHHRISVAAIGLRSPVTGTDVWPGPSAGPKARKTHRIPLLMDMQLQGALLPTVNVGPMAYAEAFLKAENQILYPKEKVARLRDLFFEFLTICLVLLTRYHHLMSSVHEAKYNAMRQSLDRYRVDLSNLLKEEIVIDEEKMVIGPRSVTSEVSSYVPALMETSVSRS